MIPHLTEEMYTNLTGDESIHLADWPKVDKKLVDEELEKQMELAREIVEEAHSTRKEKGIKVRQPLSLLTYKSSRILGTDVEKIIASEINVKKVQFESKQREKVRIDTKLTTQLKKEGEARDLIRKIQEKRKEAGVNFNSQVTVYLPSWPEEFEDLIKRETLTKNLLKGETIRLEE
jgi:isoleucyl-tRNA synthetase